MAQVLNPMTTDRRLGFSTSTRWSALPLVQFDQFVDGVVGDLAAMREIVLQDRLNALHGMAAVSWRSIWVQPAAQAR
ncbi:hypothetical protein [Methylocapsa acidiphila]|uniref:hypothetical protein n=1 Tax=Methylocapsa acidiphila TaxID=133552 RepID=UPI0012EB84F1|nr:hypothetical protein [Methylocapsa acidiphila]